MIMLVYRYIYNRHLKESLPIGFDEFLHDSIVSGSDIVNINAMNLVVIMYTHAFGFWPTVLSVAPLAHCVVCLSVCLSSVTFCILAKRCILE